MNNNRKSKCNVITYSEIKVGTRYSLVINNKEGNEVYIKGQENEVPADNVKVCRRKLCNGQVAKGLTPVTTDLFQQLQGE